MKANSKHLTLIIIGVVSMIFSVLVYWYLHNLVIEQAQNQSRTLKQIEIDNESKRNESELVDTYTKTKEDRQRLSKYIISEDKAVNVIEAVENIGDNSSTVVDISSIDTENMNGVAKGTAGHLKMHVDIKGSWNNLMRAIILLENLPYNINIGGATLSSSNNYNWNFSTDATILIVK